MSNRIGRLELLFWFVASNLGAGILIAIVASLTNTAIEFDRTRHPMAQALCLIAGVVVILKAVVSRFHDIGWSGSAVLPLFVPVVDIVEVLLLGGVSRRQRPNPYGEPPIIIQPVLRWPATGAPE